MKTHELCIAYIDAKLVRDGEICSPDLMRLFGICRQSASRCINDYQTNAVGVVYDSSRKRHIAGKTFRPTVLTPEDAPLYCDMMEMLVDMLPSNCNEATDD